MNNPTPSYLIKQSTLCTSLDTGLNGLRKLAAKDPTMPKPIKFGSSRQSPVFYDSAEIQEWLSAKKAARAGGI
jgi:predicted DNA-binding transcriptional regulator AlpA